MKIVSRLLIAAAAMVAAGGAHASFELNFDEYGNASYAVWNGSGYGPWVNDPGYLAADPTKTFAGNVLTYNLPENIVAGGVNILDLSGAISDNLFYYNVGASGYLIFTSRPGEGAPADTGVIDFGVYGATERPDETFTYIAGDGTAVGSNFYYGVSSVPEPSTWAMMLIGFAGLGFAGYRKSVKAASVAA